MPIASASRRMRVNQRLLLFIALLFTVSLSLCGAVLYTLVKQSLEKDIEQQLDNTSSTIANMVEAAVDVSVRNYLRAVAETSRDQLANIYAEYQAGEHTLEQAKAIARKSLLSQVIGKTGYIYCLNSDGLVVVHPRPGVLGTDVTEHAFVREQIASREGYLEYEWANPGEPRKRAKALYMTHFEPWDWIISVSTYREEFDSLVVAEDFREKISSIRLGDTGYVFVVTKTGDIVVHPWVEGSVQSFEKVTGKQFAEKLLKDPYGQIEYLWKERDGSEERGKVLAFRELPEVGWVVAASMYKDEIYRPVDLILRTVIFAIALSILFSIPLVWMIGRSITRPVEGLVALFNKAAAGDMKTRSEDRSPDEIGTLAVNFNEFMDRLERSNAEMERFIYTVSHDLRSPIITILGFNGILVEDISEGDTEGALSAAGRIESAAKHMHGMLDELLALSRVGRQDNLREEVDLTDLVHQVLELLHGPISQCGARVEVGELGNVTVDRPRMLEVFQNLIENSIKYAGEADPPIITVGKRKAGGCPVYYVKDNGVGIDPKYHDRVFGLFEQLSNSTPGSGVGLALVKRIVELHSGIIWVESEGLGKGSTFCFTLGDETNCQ